jgi:hypothetical protein
LRGGVFVLNGGRRRVGVQVEYLYASQRRHALVHEIDGTEQAWFELFKGEISVQFLFQLTISQIPQMIINAAVVTVGNPQLSQLNMASLHQPDE